MDLKVHENLETIKDCDEGIKEPEELLDECWFFGNLLHCNNYRMPRSFSDPCTSSNHYSEVISGEKSYEETYESIKKLPGNGESQRFNLVKAPSMPASLEARIHENSAAKGVTDHGRSKSNRKILSENLSRAPSLPSGLGVDEFQDEEIEFSMGKLIRQASMKNSDARPHAMKGVSPNYSITRHQPIMIPEMERVKMEDLEDISKPIMNQFRKQRSCSIAESKKMQGFDSKKKDTLDPQKICTIPCLQEKHTPHISAARRSRSSVPPVVPKWGGDESTDAMKEQIRFWARAVASNVH